MHQTVEDIFAIPEQSKWKQAITRDNYRGYIPLGFFTPNDGSGIADRYEGYKLHWEANPADSVCKESQLYGPNRWPVEVPEAHKIILDYWWALDRLATELLKALAVFLELSPQAFLDAFRQPLTNMTLLHYPPATGPEKSYGIHPHKDTDALTIIAPGPVAGLEVQTATGEWIQVECPPDGFIVNIGDMMELWSGGRLVSTPHRVLNQQNEERYSFPYFMVPRHDVTVSPLLEPLPGFCRPDVNCGHWSAEIWRTNWADETPDGNTPELGTMKD
jgi:isopenicillin N synthase-like dioxygenase